MGFGVSQMWVQILVSPLLDSACSFSGSKTLNNTDLTGLLGGIN